MPVSHPSSAAAAAVAAALLAGSAALSLMALSRISLPHARTAIPSPRTTLLPYLAPDEISSLGYPPDALPGARDVSTPYGCMRVYEWGPEQGRRVILVHGDATPSPLFQQIAAQLITRGCRVLTFDLWGRGYSDTPHAIQHDARLYAQQVLYAITSSPVQWTGRDTRFSLVGFSLGGAISLDFFVHQPELVESLVLLGPAGMLHSLPTEYRSFWYRHPGLVSKTKMRSLIAACLGVDPGPISARQKDSDKGFTPARALQFQFDHHCGHIESFLSTLQYGPSQRQEGNWARAGEIVRGTGRGHPNPTIQHGTTPPSSQTDGTGNIASDTGFSVQKDSVRDAPLAGGTILVICGEDDTVVPPVHVKADLDQYFGAGEEGQKEHFVFRTVPGDHGFPWSQGDEVGRMIANFWGI